MDFEESSWKQIVGVLLLLVPTGRNPAPIESATFTRGRDFSPSGPAS
jgi:uncharacterized phosphosugar-binding protein